MIPFCLIVFLFKFFEDVFKKEKSRMGGVKSHFQQLIKRAFGCGRVLDLHVDVSISGKEPVLVLVCSFAWNIFLSSLLFRCC